MSAENPQPPRPPRGIRPQAPRRLPPHLLRPLRPRNRRRPPARRRPRHPRPPTLGTIRQDLPGKRHLSLQEAQGHQARRLQRLDRLRPEFRQLLADLANGVIDGVIFYDLDRLVRQPRDLEDLIDIVEYVKRPVTGATSGRMNLINDSDHHMARMMCVMALKSSEDTARRVARQHLSAAQNGLAQGRIAYGWVRKGERKGQLVPNEAPVLLVGSQHRSRIVSREQQP
ncbi:recombinase family protein [Streptomyces benahoarensis]|uniref:Recombinase family protein n=1 Tax=Streptomyces benahoarensis TaxID=2595054 RepID=A0A553ZPW6_9ACTN|nr:recombinase family protein [Streptomyces benahoarensis]TSB43497.1 recombinase family protein [Streptomyces benahoarensis]